MIIDKAKLRAFAERLVSEHQGAKGDPVPAIGVPAADVLALLAEIERLELEALCPSCKGSGEAWVMSGSGPDAHHIQACCGECSGQGTLSVAHKTATAQRDAEHDRYIELAGKIMFGNIERDQLKAESEALRKSIAGKVVCDMELFEDLRDSAAAEADQHRQSMGSYRPQRQEALDHTVNRCDLLIVAAKEASHG